MKKVRLFAVAAAWVRMPGRGLRCDREFCVPHATADTVSYTLDDNDVLGAGTFGQVYKVRNRLDDREYALKVIALGKQDQGIEKTLREVSTMSTLSHRNVVRYYTSWIESAGA